MVLGNNKINDDEKCRRIAGNFDCHADAAVICGAYRPAEHILGFTRRRSHLMPPLGKCLCTAPPRQPPWLMNLLRKHKTLTKNLFLAGN